MKHLLDPSTQDLQNWLRDCGHPHYRDRQIRKWLFEKRAGDFHEMTDLPARLREELACDFRIWTARIARHDQAAGPAASLQ